MSGLDDLRNMASHLRGILLDSRRTAMTAVNSEMLRAYWEMGKILSETGEGENGPDGLLEALSAMLAPEFGKAFSAKKLAAIRSFYGEYAHRPPLIRFHETNELAESGLPPLNPRLSWTHYRLFLTLPGEEERKAAERMTLRERWSVSDLENRLGEASSLACPDTEEECGGSPSFPEDFASDPHVQAFLGVPERQRLTETVLERALIDHLQTFFLEKGQDLYLAERQKQLSDGGEDVYTDLLFYSRPLHAFFAADLVYGDFTREDERRMERVLRKIMEDGLAEDETENPPVGLLLSVRKERGRMRYIFLRESAELEERYRSRLPAEKDIAAELERERDEILVRYPYLEE